MIIIIIIIKKKNNNNNNNNNNNINKPMEFEAFTDRALLLKKIIIIEFV